MTTAQALRSRREFLKLAAVGATALAAPSRAVAALAATAPDPAVAAYATRPDLTPPRLAVETAGPGLAPGRLLLAPFTGPGQHGPLIVDDAGEPLWFRPVEKLVWDLRAQRLEGKPVLTWWEGAERTDTWHGIVLQGWLDGECVIADTSYRVVKRLRSSFLTDPHDFLLTSRGTALVAGLNPLPRDLSPYGASASGILLEGVVEEIDLATGKVLLAWHSADHVDPGESYGVPSDAWDYFHLNSIGVTPDGSLIVSARYTSAVYKLDRKSGAVRWRLGGKKSDFQLGTGASFAYQHDARSHPGNLVSIFDDGADAPGSGPESTSRAILLRLDPATMTAELAQELPNPHGSLTVAMGNAQLLPGGGWMVGWGAVPELSEFAPDATLRFDATFVGGGLSYRAYRQPWVGRPLTRPAVAASGNTDGTLDVFASWNGATEVTHWRVLGGASTRALAGLRTVPRTGFETPVRLPRRPVFVAVEALDATGTVLGRSEPLTT